MSKTLINVLLLALSIILAVAGQLTMKAGMNKVGEIGGEDISHLGNLILRVIKSVWAVVGILLYAISAVFWLVILSRVDLSVAYPLVAAGYVLVVIFSWLVFKEDVRWVTWVGLALIVAGVILVGQGLKGKSGESGKLEQEPQVCVCEVQDKPRISHDL